MAPIGEVCRRQTLPQSSPARDAPDRQSNPRRSSLQIFHTELTTSVHAVCRRCGHWIDGKKWTFTSNPKQHSSLVCDKCGTKVFGLGGDSARSSLASLLTRSSFGPSIARRRSSLLVCTNAGEVSPHASLFSPRSTRQAREVQALATNHEESSDNQHRPFFRSLGGDASEPAARPGDEEVDTDARRAADALSAHDVPERDRHTSSISSRPRPKRRVKCLRLFARSLRRLLGSDVDIQITQKSLVEVSTDGIAEPAQLPVPISSSSRPPVLTDPFHKDSADIRGKAPAAQASNTVPLSQSPTAANSNQGCADVNKNDDQEADDAPRENHPRKEDYRTQRKGQRVYRKECRCTPGNCHCVAQASEEEGANTTYATTSLIHTSRSSTEQTAPRSSRSASQQWRDFILSQVGGLFSAFQHGGHDSIISSNSGRAESQRTSASRPSQISIQVTERSSNHSRADSGAGRAAQAFVMPAVMGAAIGRSPVDRRQSSDMNSTPASSPRFPTGLIADAPQEVAEAGPSRPPPSPLRPPLRVDTDASQLSINAANGQDSAEPSSRGDSSVTMTQERQQQVERLRGLRPDEGS